MPVLGAAIGGGAAAMGLARMTRKRRRQAVVRELVGATDKMIQGANVTAETMATLRADKVMLAQMLANINEEPENEQ
jgi:hypothetical protein